MKSHFLPVFFIVIFTGNIAAQDAVYTVVQYCIGMTDFAKEFDTAAITWSDEKVVKKNQYGEEYSETGYKLELKLQNTTTKSIETILFTGGAYAGGYSIYFENVVFPRNREMQLRCEYYENSESNTIVLSLYDKDSQSNVPYVILELK